MTVVVPTFWISLCTRVFGTTEKYACRLWQHYPASPLLLWQLSRCTERPDDPIRWFEHVKRLGELLSPGDLIRLSLTLHPETGRPRAREAVQFELGVLNNLNAHGDWVW
jgi:hypothetical protein